MGSAAAPAEFEDDSQVKMGHASCVSASPSDEEAPRLDSTVRRKVDMRIIPLVTVLYLCCFLDRSNLGNARIAGMAEDLTLVGMRYQIAAAAFFLTYSLLEVPCNVLLKLLRPSIWIPCLTVAWGTVMMSMAALQTWQGLVVARLMLGVAEAGLAPALAFIVATWYTRDQQARPIACYFSAATLAGAFGGLLAFCIEKMNGIGGLHGWQWIFLLEGLLTVLVGFGTFFVMVDYPNTATFLTHSERDHLLDVLRRDTTGEPSHFEMRFVWEVMLSPKSWLMCGLFLGFGVPVYAFSLFIPTIIHALGFSTTHSQLLTIAPFAAACCTTIGIGALSDRARIRGPFILGCSLFSAVGYTILLATDVTRHPYVGYAASIIAAMGMFPGVPLVYAWSSGNAGGSLKKAVIMAFIGTFSNLGGLCSSFVYRTQDAPRFILGHSVVLGFLGLAFGCAAVSMLWFRSINKRNERICAEKRGGEVRNTGPGSPLFRYGL